MTFRAGSFSLLLSALLVAACGTDRPTAPTEDLSLKASVNTGTPAPLSASPISNVAIAVSWTDNSPNETGFEVHRSTTGIGGTYTLIATVGAGVTSYQDGSRQPLTEYCYKARTVRAKGNAKPTYSDFSNPSCATTFGPPPAPASIDATPGPYDEISVAWGFSSTASGYRLFRSLTGSDPWDRVGGGDLYATSYVDRPRDRETRYCYRVTAFNAWGENTSTIDCTAIPVGPSNVTATAIRDHGGVDVTWKDESGYEDGYEVQRAGSDFNFSSIASLPLGTEAYHDPLTTDGEWWYRVRAKKDGGYSVFSSAARAVVANTPPAAPSELRSSAPSSETAYMYWSDNSSNETAFGIERSAAGGPWTLAGTTGWNIYWFTDGDRVPEQEVCYRVFAKNDGGESARSLPDCTTPLAAPTNLVATTSAEVGAIDLEWTALPSTAAGGFEIKRYVCEWTGYYYGWQCYYTTIAEVGADARTFHDTGLVPGEWNSYYVVAFKDRPDGGGRSESNWSNEYGAAAGQP